MNALPRAHSIADGAGADDQIALTYDARILRRKRLVTDAGLAFMVDLAQTTSLDHGDAFVLDDGRRVAVVAADEPLLHITGDQARMAWHIGNRHAPCQILPDGLRVQAEKVMHRMLEQLGADVTEINAPFTPEGGAYGHGRTMGHSHGEHAHSHDHDHDHQHSHDHSHSHDAD